jgi:hypothetical protein
MATAAIAGNREAWLTDCGTKLQPLVEEAVGKKLPKWRISISFPSRGGLAIRKRTVGQCWSPLASADGVVEILISPVLHNVSDIIGTVAHEMIHAAGIHGHKEEFKRAGLKLGLVGKPTHMGAGPEFIKKVGSLIEEIGYELPHSPIIADGNPLFKPEKGRMLKAYCPKCDYTVRVTRKWLDEAGAPFCPTDMKRMVEQKSK